MVYDQAPDLCLGCAIAPVHEIAMLVPLDGPGLEHIVQLGTDAMVVLARETVPESFLRGLEFPAWHILFNVSTVLTGEASTASLVGR